MHKMRSHKFAADSIQGTGIGLRTPHVITLLTEDIGVPWLEVLVDNHLADGGFDRAVLFGLREKFPMNLHGVSASAGGFSPIDKGYLYKIKDLMNQLECAWFSDHLCFTEVNGVHSHDLLPLPYTEEAVKHCAERITQIQDYLGHQILIENVSSYVQFTHAAMHEVEFINAVAEAADCFLLLDLNNIYVNQFNHGFNAKSFIDQVALKRVKEIHLGGHEDKQTYLLDAHNNPVSDSVWGLYAYLLEKTSSIPTLIEWDNDIPELERLMQEKNKADALHKPYAEIA